MAWLKVVVTAIDTAPPSLDDTGEDLSPQMMTGAVEVLDAADCVPHWWN